MQRREIAMTADIHMHTSFSTDSETPVEEMVEKAISCGMDTICITDHQDYGLAKPGYFQVDPEAYWEKMEQVRDAYRDRIRILTGIEIGMHMDYRKEIDAFIHAYPFDFILGSVHLVDGIDPYDRALYPGTDDVMYRHYFEQTLECVRHIDGFQSLGHLDYVVRYGYDRDVYSYEKYADVIDEILKELIARGIALEVNTGGYKSGIGYPNPHPDVLRRYRELGGERITLGADAHNPAYIGYEFARAEKVIRDAGFREITIYVGKKPEILVIPSN